MRFTLTFSFNLWWAAAQRGTDTFATTQLPIKETDSFGNTQRPQKGWITLKSLLANDLGCCFKMNSLSRILNIRLLSY